MVDYPDIIYAAKILVKNNEKVYENDSIFKTAVNT